MSNANEDRPIWLKSLADADRHQVPTAAFEDRLQNALRARRRHSLTTRAGMLVLVAALGLLAVRISTNSLTLSTEVTEDELSQAIDEATVWGGENGADFFPTQLATEQPLEAVRVVRVSLTPGELAAYGLYSDPGLTGNEVTAELLVGQDGIARAVRVVR